MNGAGRLAVLVNGVPARDQPRGSLFFQPVGPGFCDFGHRWLSSPSTRTTTLSAAPDASITVTRARRRQKPSQQKAQEALTTPHVAKYSTTALANMRTQSAIVGTSFNTRMQVVRYAELFAVTADQFKAFMYA